MDGKARGRAAALTALQYALVNDFNVGTGEKVIQDIVAETWCLVNGYELPSESRGVYSDMSTRDIISMLRRDESKALERAHIMLLAAREFSYVERDAERGTQRVRV